MVRVDVDIRWGLALHLLDTHGDIFCNSIHVRYIQSGTQPGFKHLQLPSTSRPRALASLAVLRYAVQILNRDGGPVWGARIRAP